MRSIGHWKLRTKIITAFAVVVALGTVSGLWNLANFRWAAAAFQVASREQLPAVDAIVEADRDMQQALVAERTLMFVRQASDEATALRKDHADNLGQVRTRWGKYKAIRGSAEEQRLQPQFEAALADWEKLSREIVALLAQDDRDARKDAIDLSLGEGTAKFEKARGVLNKLTDLRLQGATAFADEVQASAARTTGFTVAAILVLIGGSAVVGTLLTRQIVRALRYMVARAEQAATGDLTVRVGRHSTDELGLMGQALDGMLDRFARSMGQVQRAALQTAAAAQQLSAASRQISAGAQEQAASIEETAASLEEITGTVKQNADNARQANQLAAAARGVAEKGGEVVNEAVHSMTEISPSSRRIADIITAIDEIAFQTNLLALNAAVEAARAGEQGRGFAVVASEVRNLAQRSATAAKEIKTLIQDSVQKVGTGAELVHKSGGTLTDIVTSVKRVTDIIGEIAAASQEQTTGIDQVNRSVAQMDDVTQANAAQTEELSSTAQSLAEEARRLQTLVAQFRVDADSADEPEPAVTLPVQTVRVARRAAPAVAVAAPRATPALALAGAPRHRGPEQHDGDAVQEF
jgi:methyl-accepting chemotaxis protein